MKLKLTGSVLAAAWFACANHAAAQGTAFTYQGQLSTNGIPLTGIYNMSFALYNSGGMEFGNPIVNNNVPVTNGLFTVTMDFGSTPFNGGAVWLGISVGTNGAPMLTALTSRQDLTPAPYAIFATTAGTISGTLPPGSLSGTYGGAVTLNNPGNSFTGNGAGLTDVNATTLNGYDYCSLPCYWNLAGNAGTTPGVNFLGTTDNRALELHVNSTRGLEMIPGAPDAANLAGGFFGNIIDPGLNGAVIAGGGTANFSGQPSTNHVSASYSSIGGGSGNWIEPGADHSIIGCGLDNLLGAYQSVVAGGENNTITPGASWSVVSGGWANTNQAQRAVIAGGVDNNIQGSANQSFIGGGAGNTIWAGDGNATIVGGSQNTLEAGTSWSFVGGGDANIIYSGVFSTVVGGTNNLVFDSYSIIGGGENNEIFVGASGSVIGGGVENIVYSSSTIGGGVGNYVGTSTGGSTIAGGAGNAIQNNTLPYLYEGNGNTIGGGQYNNIGPNGGDSTIAGGYYNTNNSVMEAIGGGSGNTCGGFAAAIPGGYRNLANGQDSFAGGTQAQALNDGAFVWADDDQSPSGLPFPSVANNEFAVRATGGVRFVTATSITGSPVAGVTLPAGGGSWMSISDRNVKEDFAHVTSQDVLAKVAALPITKWSYKTEKGVRHIGPMAQDFYSAFGVGEDDRHITTIDEDGVALAAIQGLNQKLDEKDATIQQQAAAIADLKARLAKIEQMINSRNGGGQ